MEKPTAHANELHALQTVKSSSALSSNFMVLELFFWRKLADLTGPLRHLTGKDLRQTLHGGAQYIGQRGFFTRATQLDNWY
jgi:hypothetical protein